VFSSKIHEIGAEIMTGNIINHLLKPISFFSYVITKEIADKTINVTCALIEISLLIMLLQPNITIQTDLATIFVGIVFLMIGIAISFFISFCTSMIAFWTAEIWAPRFIYLILVFVLAGNYFPLDILPQPLYNVLLFTPFPYFMFLPAHIFIKGATSGLILPFIIGTSWACITFIIARILWKKGMKEYSFYGR
jgi:ABC-2 type transport system permease protein